MTVLKLSTDVLSSLVSPTLCPQVYTLPGNLSANSSLNYVILRHYNHTGRLQNRNTSNVYPHLSGSRLFFLCLSVFITLENLLVLGCHHLTHPPQPTVGLHLYRQHHSERPAHRHRLRGQHLFIWQHHLPPQPASVALQRRDALCGPGRLHFWSSADRRGAVLDHDQAAAPKVSSQKLLQDLQLGGALLVHGLGDWLPPPAGLELHLQHGRMLHPPPSLLQKLHLFLSPHLLLHPPDYRRAVRGYLLPRPQEYPAGSAAQPQALRGAPENSGHHCWGLHPLLGATLHVAPGGLLLRLSPVPHLVLCRHLHLPRRPQLWPQPHHLRAGQQRDEEGHGEAAVLLLPAGRLVPLRHLHVQGDQQHLGEPEGQPEEQFQQDQKSERGISALNSQQAPEGVQKVPPELHHELPVSFEWLNRNRLPTQTNKTHALIPPSFGLNV
ncbi:unnamed protein product [Tetraodon nigroviridis]|uniref:Chromosome 1 SCAF14995, whole genome shotgun sequence n=1 Tax=Tetraodon nigroviridis TaxID=99883 RepID=Q4RUB3_TETNG|nr:unnamed protein product [Tetraodon nigroviridis]